MSGRGRQGGRVAWGVRVVVVVAVCWLEASLAAAQTQTVNGRVLDPQGGAVVDAQVSLSRNVQRRVVKTAADGGFAFEAVEPGRYGLVVESPGFMAWSMEIGVGTGLQPVNVTLQIAGVVEDVQVSGEAPYNLTKPAPTASRLGLSPLETPASVSVVSGDVIRGLGTPTLIVAKSFAPGITSSAPMGSGGNVLNARGFTGVNSVKQLFNGMEIYNAGGVVSFPFDPWNVDHIGVLSGPASVLYGTGAIGGAVNVVPRRPDPSTHRGEVQLGIGRYGQFHEAIDLTGPLNDRVSYRFDASVYNFGHWVDRGESNSQAISGSVRIDATPKLRFTVSNDFGNQDPSKYLGTPVFNNAPVPGLRYTNYNVLDAELNFTDNWTNVETIWTPSSTLSYHNNTYFLYHDRIYRDAPNYAFVPATFQVRRTQFRDINNTYETQYGNTGYLRQSGRILGRRNEVLVGFDLNRNYYHRYDNVRGGTSVVNALIFDPGNYLDFYNQEAKPFYRIDVDQAALFAENQLHVTDRLSGVVGVRRDNYHVTRKDDQTFVTTESHRLARRRRVRAGPRPVGVRAVCEGVGPGQFPVQHRGEPAGLPLVAGTADRVRGEAEDDGRACGVDLRGLRSDEAGTAHAQRRRSHTDRPGGPAVVARRRGIVHDDRRPGARERQRHRAARPLRRLPRGGGGRHDPAGRERASERAGAQRQPDGLLGSDAAVAGARRDPCGRPAFRRQYERGRVTHPRIPGAGSGPALARATEPDHRRARRQHPRRGVRGFRLDHAMAARPAPFPGRVAERTLLVLHGVHRPPA
jgi:hypothetical protein